MNKLTRTHAEGFSSEMYGISSQISDLISRLAKGNFSGASEMIQGLAEAQTMLERTAKKLMERF